MLEGFDLAIAVAKKLGYSLDLMTVPGGTKEWLFNGIFLDNDNLSEEDAWMTVFARKLLPYYPSELFTIFVSAPVRSGDKYRIEVSESGLDVTTTVQFIRIHDDLMISECGGKHICVVFWNAWIDYVQFIGEGRA